MNYNKTKRIKPIFYGESMEIFLTNQCNCKCIFCHSSEFEGEPTLNQTRTFLMEAKKKGVKTIQITGGEPTLSKNFIETIYFAKNLGFHNIRTVSNGRKFSDFTFTKKAHESGLKGYIIALQSHIAEIHDELVNSPSAFNETIGGLKNLLSLTYPINVTINTIITKSNYQHLPQLVEFLQDLGIEKIFFCFPFPNGACFENFDQVVPYHDEVRPYLFEALELIQNKTKELITIDNYPLCFFGKYENFACLLNITAHPDKGYLPCPQKNICLYKKMCPGIQKNYILKRGWKEFMPVCEQQIENKKILFSINPELIPKINAETLKTPFGVHLRTKDHRLIILKSPGYSLVEKIDAKNSLKNLLHSNNQDGQETLNFIGSLYIRGFLQFINGSPITLKKKNETLSHKIEQNFEFEYETYNNSKKNYPLVIYDENTK